MIKNILFKYTIGLTLIYMLNEIDIVIFTIY